MSTASTQPDLHHLGVAELAAKLAAREVSSVEVAQHFLARIKQQDALGAFLALDADVSEPVLKLEEARFSCTDRVIVAVLRPIRIEHRHRRLLRGYPSHKVRVPPLFGLLLGHCDNCAQHLDRR